MFRRAAVLLTFAFALLGAAESAEAQRRVRINVESTPPGATVYVDSADGAPLGVTPIKGGIVRAGSHKLIFKKDGHETTELNVNVRRWRETFRATLQAQAKLVATPVNSASQGATLYVDGEKKGILPYRGTLEPGRHLIKIEKEGHETYEEWHDLEGTVTLPVMLEKDAPDTGSILVAGGRPGAEIYIDGEPHGTTPTVVEDVPAGERKIEVRLEGSKPHEETVRVTAGERVTVNPDFGPVRGPEGSVRVITQPSGATVLIDGETVGSSPVTKDGLSPGQHIVEASAEGYDSAQKEVEVEAGEQQVISLSLTGEKKRPGRIVVNATVNDAEVIIDGENKGQPPVVVEDPSQGTHAIVVKARGYTDFRTTCEVSPTRDCEITARMEGVGTPVRVESNAPGAEFYVDGERMGPVPWEGTVPVGSHRIEVRAPGYEPHVEQVLLRVSSEARGFNVALRPEGAKDEEDVAAERQARMQATREAASYSAAPLPQDMTVLDISAGWPWLAQARLGVGIVPFLEAGFALRSFGRLTEFEGRTKAGWRPIKQLALGGQFRIGGGIGPNKDVLDDDPTDDDLDGHPTNSFFMSIEALATLHFSQAAAVTMWFAGDFTSDRWDFAADDVGSLHTGIPAQVEDRQNIWRARIGGVIEILINRKWNMFGLLEGVVAGPDRRIFGDVFRVGKSDTKLYGQLGFTYKFGLAREEGTTFGVE